MVFFDLHAHLLCGVDDGAENQAEMFRMLEMSYSDGTRSICVTPHFSAYLGGADSIGAADAAFEALSDYAAEHTPDLKLYRGNELGFSSSAFDALKKGLCRTVADSRYVLTDFPESADFFEVDNALRMMMRLGYRPILAHTERYRCLASEKKWMRDFVRSGGVIQINAASAVGQAGLFAKRQWKMLIREGLAQVISSDMHNTSSRPPMISVCLPFLRKYCDPDTAHALLWENASRIVTDQDL